MLWDEHFSFVILYSKEIFSFHHLFYSILAFLFNAKTSNEIPIFHIFTRLLEIDYLIQCQRVYGNRNIFQRWDCTKQIETPIISTGPTMARWCSFSKRRTEYSNVFYLKASTFQNNQRMNVAIFDYPYCLAHNIFHLTKRNFNFSFEIIELQILNESWT